MQVAHENLGLLLIRQIEVDPLGWLDIPDRDRAEQLAPPSSPGSMRRTMWFCRAGMT